MCGRYTVLPKSAKGHSKAAKLVEKHLKETHYNAAPSQALASILSLQVINQAQQTALFLSPYKRQV